MHLATQFHRESIINTIIRHDEIKLNTPDVFNMTPLTYAFDTEQYATLAIFLSEMKKQHASGNDDQPFDPNELLHFVSNNKSDLVDLIVELLTAVGWGQGEDGETGGSLLHSAAKNDDIKTMGALLKKGNVDINKRAERPGIFGSDMLWQEGDTPLHVAARTASLNAIKFIVENGGDEKVFNSRGLAPLHLAVKSGSLEAVKSLVESIDGIAIAIKSGDKTTPLHIASYSGNVQIAKYLIENDASVHLQNHEGWTPLHHAAECNQVKIIQLLVASEANIDARSKNTNTPLHTAVVNREIDAVECLLALGGLVNARGDKNFTPLHKAAKAGDALIARTLLNAGARYDHRAENKNTPLHTAAAHGKGEPLKILVAHHTEHSTDLNKSGFNGWNPLHQASIGGHVGAMEVLIDSGVKINHDDDFNLDTALHLAAR